MPKLYMAPVDLLRWRLARKYTDGRWSQEYAAEWAGVSARTWRRYERGESIVPQWLIRRLVRTRLTPSQKAYLATLPPTEDR